MYTHKKRKKVGKGGGGEVALRVAEFLWTDIEDLVLKLDVDRVLNIIFRKIPCLGLR